MARETQGSPADEKKLEQYGVWVKVKPRDVTAPVLDESFELSDLESSSPASSGGLAAKAERAAAAAPVIETEPENALTEEEEKLLDDLETELEPEDGAEGGILETEILETDLAEEPAISVPEEEPLLAESELPDIEGPARAGSSDLEMADVTEEELPELEQDLDAAPFRAAEPAEVEVTLSEDLAEEESFDDLAALETELASVTTKTAAAGGAAASAVSGSAEILSRIEDELKSIRADLTQLRTDLSGLRKSAAESEAKAAAAEPGIKGGFLDEDEDETIALTGDELDNILNTAEITEEVTEAGAPAEAETDIAVESAAEEPSGDILGYETPAPEPVEAPLPQTEEVLDIPEAEVTDETLVLGDEDLLPTDGSTASAEELPSDLVLEEVPLEDGAESAVAETLPEIDLEGVPEIETEPAASPAAEEEESETIDLETLDLGEEPRVIDAVPEQVEEVTDLEVEEAAPLEADEVTELGTEEVAELGTEEVTELGTEEVLDLGTEEIPELASGEVTETEEAPLEAAADSELPEVDLEALAAEAEDLEDEVPEAPLVEDLEIGELEAVADESAAAAPQKEIEISFEADLAEEPEAAAAAEPEEILEMEEIPEAEEAAPAAGASAPAAASASGIPDNLKDEIRTVLKYMDHLLEALPDEKIQEFASSDYFVMYKKLFEDLGLGE